MNINDLNKLEKLFNCKFNVQNTGSPEWKRAFVLNSDGVQIGRLSFLNGKLVSIKSYKKDYHIELCETDEIFFRMSRYVHDGMYIPMWLYKEFILIAKDAIEKRFQECVAWRKANPKKGFDKKGKPKRRRRLQKRNLRFAVYELCMTS